MKIENKPFATDNFALATFLLTENCKLLSIDKKNPKRAIFVFQDSAERKSLTDKFWRLEASVEPQQFFSTQKQLKNMLFSSSYPS